MVQNMSSMKCSKCSFENYIFGDSVQELAKQEGLTNYFINTLFNGNYYLLIINILIRNRYIIFNTFGFSYYSWL